MVAIFYYLFTYAFVWMAVTPGLGFWRAMVMTQASIRPGLLGADGSPVAGQPEWGT